MMIFLVEAAVRSLLMAISVWAVIRALRVQTVLAQKVAWVLVLLAAAIMPLAMRAPWIGQAMDRAGIQALRIPVGHAPDSRSETQTVSQFANEAVMPLRVAQTPSAARIVSQPVHARHSAKAILTPLTTEPAAVPASPAPAAGRITSQSPWRWPKLDRSLLLLYLSITAVLLLRMVAGLGVAFRLWRASVPASNLPSLPLGFHHVRISARLATPVTIGSTILLPADCAEWDEAKLRIVLAHEHSHVRQGDFYLQTLAALHTAIFWFSPLGWWLQRKISELGEALSDRAGLEQAQNPAAYAQVLLEFAARPRTIAFAGVGMARNSNLSSRIERVLNARNFRLAFLGRRSHAVLAAILAPAALVAVVALIRIVPAVEAAQAQSTATGPSQSSGRAYGSGTSSSTTGTAGGQTGKVSSETAEQISAVGAGQSSDEVSTPPAPPALSAAQAPAPPPVEAQEPLPPPPPVPGKSYFFAVSEDGNDSFAIVPAKDSDITFSGTPGAGLEKAKRKFHGNFIWFEHDGKSWVITDPAIVAQSQALFKRDHSLAMRQEQLQKLQAQLSLDMAKIQPQIDKAKLPGPEFAEQMAKLEAELAELRSDKYSKMAEEITKGIQDKVLTEVQIKELTDIKLEELQGKIGEIQGRIGELQGQIGNRAIILSDKQAEIAEKMGKLGEEMGRIGESEGKNGEEASRRVKSLLDQAVKDGKARPID